MSGSSESWWGKTSESIKECVWHRSRFVSPQPNPDSPDWTRSAPGPNPNLVALLLHAFLWNIILIACSNPWRISAVQQRATRGPRLREGQAATWAVQGELVCALSSATVSHCGEMRHEPSKAADRWDFKYDPTFLQSSQAFKLILVRLHCVRFGVLHSRHVPRQCAVSGWVKKQKLSVLPPTTPHPTLQTLEMFCEWHFPAALPLGAIIKERAARWASAMCSSI